jgi:serine/threonine protein kinase
MVRVVFWILFGLLSAAALTLLALTLLAGRLESRVREAVLAAGKLGQYALEEKIGEGGMGSVYRARHALLRRPTAIKLIEPSKTSDVAVARFEREVQHTSQLNHPNTITIYDYGRTDEGVFYYAMEFLDGFSLQAMVEKFGPQPDGRVIPILLQVCGSLLEAHSLGLIHRDIKPANIMLTRRAGVSDFVKLLDFGLVKATDNRMQTQLTAVNSITGTPLYLPPECIQDPESADARSDLYSLGGVGYYLLTGRPPFEATSVLEIIRRQVEDIPVAPSEKSGRPIAPQLEQVLLACLEKSPDKRPQSAAQLAELLSQGEPRESWTAAEAQRWWRENLPGSDSVASDAVTEEIHLSATVGSTTVPRKV